MNKNFLLTILWAGLSLYAQTTLSLAECTATARAQSAAVQQAKSGLEAAKAQQSQANTQWFPRVTANAFAMKSADYLVGVDNAGGNLPVYDGNMANLGTSGQYAYMPASSMQMLDRLGMADIAVVQPVYAGGRIQNGNKLATLGVDVARLQLAQSEKEAVLATQNRYYALVALQSTRQTLLSQRALLDTLSHDVGLAYRAGLATSRDTLELAHNRLTVDKFLQDVDAGIALAGRDLCHSLAMRCTGMVQLTDSLGPLQAPELLRLDHDQAKASREENQLLEKSVTAAELKGALDQGAFRPQVMVGADFFASSDFDSAPTRGAVVFALMQVPFSGFWEGAYHAKNSRATEEQSRVQAKDMQGMLVLQMDKAWNDLDAAWRAHGLAQHKEEQEAIALADARQRFAQGLDKAADLVEAQAKLQSAAEAEINARRDYLQARAMYLKVTGRASDAL